MDKTLYRKYIDAVSNIGVYPNSYVVHEVWVSKRYHFQSILFTTFHVEVKGKIMTIEEES